MLVGLVYSRNLLMKVTEAGSSKKEKKNRSKIVVINFTFCLYISFEIITCMLSSITFTPFI